MRGARAAIVAALAFAALCSGAGTGRAAEPFYIGLLEAGSREYLRGDFTAAAQKLRVASFGLLDEPPLLTRALVRLALAQAGADDDLGFEETFERLVEVEAAFGSYGSLPADTPFKIELERLLPQRFSVAELETIPAFAAVVAAMREAKLTALPPKRLRRELDRRLAVNPGDTEALVLITRLDIAQDREDRAEQRIVSLLAASPEHRMARCLHGQIRLRRDECAAAMEDLTHCTQPPTDEVLGARYLRCLVQAADWQAAGGYLASLPLDLRSREEVANLILAIPPETLDGLARAPLETGGATESTIAEAGPPQAEPPTPPAPVAIETTESLRRQAGTAADRAELDRVFGRIADRAEALPTDVELQHLAGEVAYRRADYPAAVRYFRRGGIPGPDEALARFYLAIALFETGDQSAAAELLRDALPRLEKTPFVERYRAAILADGGSG